MRFYLVVPPAQERRLARLATLAGDIARGRPQVRALTPVAWAFLAGLIGLATQSAHLGWLTLAGLALFAGLAWIALFDARYFIIPDGAVIYLFFTGLVTSLIATPGETPERLVAAGVGYGALRLVAAAYEKWRGEAGLGLGDAKLFAAAGLWLGLAGLPISLLFATFSALITTIVSFRDGALTSARQPIPFGPHLALGLWLVFVIGPRFSE